jgi:hypothetical protein
MTALLAALLLFGASCSGANTDFTDSDTETSFEEIVADDSEILHAKNTPESESSINSPGSENTAGTPAADKITDESSEEEQPPEDALRDLINIAGSGDVMAQSRLGRLYYYGSAYGDITVEPNPEQALFWILKAAQNGSAYDIYNAGYMYLHAEGTETDYEKALYYLQKCGEEHNHPESLNAIGYMYYEGLGVNKNPEKAAEYFLRAGGGHDADGWGNLAQMHETGIGVTQNIELSALYNMLALRSFSKTDRRDIKEKLLNYLDSQSPASKIIDLGTLPTNNKLIPSGLLDEARRYFYAYDKDLFLEKYGVDCRVDPSDFEKNSISQFSERLRDDGFFYLADMDNCGEDELIVYEMGGTVGNAFITYAKKNETGVFEIKRVAELWGRQNKIIKYEGKYYLVYFTVGFGGEYGSICIFAFDSETIAEVGMVYANTSSQHAGYIQTYKSPDFSDADAELFNNIMPEVMAKTVYIQGVPGSGFYEEMWGNEKDASEFGITVPYMAYSENNQLAVHKLTDINNDGEDEILSREIWGSTSMGMPDHIDYAVGIKNSAGKFEPIENFRDTLSIYNGSRAVKQIFVEESNGKNYLVLLEEQYAGNNFNFDVYLIENGNAKLMSSHFIYRLYDIEISVDNEYDDYFNR